MSFIRLYELKKFIYPMKEKPNFLILKKILESVKKETSIYNTELYFVYLPEYSRYKRKYDNTNYLQIKQIIKNLNINFVDVHSDFFLKMENPLIFFPFEMYGHYNELGYDGIAKFIYLSSN